MMDRRRRRMPTTCQLSQSLFQIGQLAVGAEAGAFADNLKLSIRHPFLIYRPCRTWLHLHSIHPTSLRHSGSISSTDRECRGVLSDSQLDPHHQQHHYHGRLIVVPATGTPYHRHPCIAIACTATYPRQASLLLSISSCWTSY
jgi:hypothetical protein